VQTISPTDRVAVLGDLVHLQTDQITVLPLFFQGSAVVVGSTRLKNTLGGYLYNAHEWEVD
jgi:hypothetical protein